MSAEKVDSDADSSSHVVNVLSARGSPRIVANEEHFQHGVDGTGDSRDIRSVDSEATGWSTLLRYSKEFDEKMLRDWQDELANLLTFTGLFSAVVTGFVVVSILMLQEDTGQRTVALLDQISQQLSSLNVAQNMINSTVQPNFATPLFVPEKSAVDINILWISSLTLSLMAAFWTIAVQQWLRHIPLPRESTVRESIRLRQLRHDGMMSWKIPAIVSLLPLVVQIAVLLFLVGLLLLLRGLDHRVGDTFAIIGGALFSLFLVTVPLPLVFPACPFKSPLLPTLWTIFQFTLGPALIACLIVIVNVSSVLIFFVSPVIWTLLKLVHIVRDDYFDSSYHATILFGSKRIDIWTAYLGRLLTFDANPHVFWRLRERWYVRRGKNGARLDRSVLSSVPTFVPEPDRGSIMACLQALPAENDRMLAAVKWVCRDLGIERSELRCWPMGVIPYLFGGTIEKLDASTLARLRPIIFEALPRDWTTFDMFHWSYFNSNKPEVFTMTMLSLLVWSVVPNGTNPTDADAFGAVVGLLSQIRDAQFDGDEKRAQDIVNETKQALWLPLTLLFRCYLQGYTPSYHEATRAAAVAQSIFLALDKQANDMLDFAELSAALPGALAAAATALHAFAALSMPTASDDGPSNTPSNTLSSIDILPTLHTFEAFLSSPDATRTFASQQLLRPVDTSSVYLVDKLAVRSIASSLVRLAEDGHVCVRADCPSRGVAERLLEICALSGEYNDAVAILREFVGAGL